MSSILEALRKSDDKRQQGQNKASDHIRFSETQTARKSRKGFYLLVLLLLMVAAGLWAHQAGYLAQLTSLWSSEHQDDTAAVVVEPKAKEHAPVSKAVVENDLKLQPPKPNQVKQQILAKENGKEAKKDNQEKKVGASKGDEIDLVKPEVTSEKASRLIVDGKQAKAQSDDLSAKPETKQKPQKQPQRKERTQSYLLVHQLPFATRQQLPELKINVHVFDPEPENRMVVINGVSFVIGDDVEGVAQVKDITAEGVVIDMAGTVFMIPK